MRIIHTADWHIGQTLEGYARDHEHRAVLKSLARIAVEREADALVVCGDVFDHANPSGEAQRLLYESLVELKRMRPAMTIVLTAGNHDAAGRLEAPETLLRPQGVRVVGSVRRVDGRIVDANRHLVPLPGAGGEVAAHVLAVSYPTAACLPPSRAVEGEGADSLTRLLYAELVEACGAGRDGLPLILTGHLHVAGGLESEGSERRIFVGGEHAVSPAVFPDIAAYVALGHLHKAQLVETTVRYSGSPLPLSATEIPYVHGVSLVTVDGGRIEVEHIPIARPVAFLRLPERGEARLDEVGDRLQALGLPADLPIERRPFVQVWLSREGLEGPAAGWRAEVERVTDPFPVRLVGPPRLAPAPERATEPSALASLQRLADLRPEDLFCRAFAQKHGAEPGPEHIAVFHKVAAAAVEA